MVKVKREPRNVLPPADYAKAERLAAAFDAGEKLGRQYAENVFTQSPFERLRSNLDALNSLEAWRGQAHQAPEMKACSLSDFGYFFDGFVHGGRYQVREYLRELNDAEGKEG